MRLKELLKGLKIKKVVGNINNIHIKNLTDNSSRVLKDGLFIAVKGLRVDGHNFVNQAIKNGAVALVVEKELEVNTTQIIVENTRKSLGILANNFYKNPIEDIKIISVVGTNGKTTTTYIIEDILKNAGLKVGVIGTSAIVINGEKQKANLTTPDPVELFKIFADMKKAEIDVVVMEISAHAIKLNKTSGFKSDVAVFTNFSQDHLDFFKNMDDYKNTKKSYFTKEFCNLTVINSDDLVGKELINETELKTLTYGIKNPSDVFLINLSMSLEGSSYFINLQDTVRQVNFNLPAKFNVYNSLAAATACLAIGLNANKIVDGLNKEHNIDGRFNLIKVGKNCNVIIDYAHTPKALENLLKTVKSLSKDKIVSVFGCPGNRDESKRSIMGEIAGQYSDFVIVTDDNCDIENPLKIMSHIEEGLKLTKTSYKIIERREKAIEHALNSVDKSIKTTVIIAGKGHEQYQIINNVKSPYNDKETVLKIIENKTKKLTAN